MILCQVTLCKPAFPAAALDLLTSCLLSAQAKKAQQLHDDKIVMAKTLAENDANSKAKKKAAQQQMCCAAHLLVITLISCIYAFIHSLTHRLTNSLTHPPSHPHTHSPTHLLMRHLPSLCSDMARHGLSCSLCEIVFDSQPSKSIL